MKGRGPIDRLAEQRTYREGGAARRGRRPKAYCPYGEADTPVQRAWWFAGWNDADLEGGKR